MHFTAQPLMFTLQKQLGATKLTAPQPFSTQIRCFPLRRNLFQGHTFSSDYASDVITHFRIDEHVSVSSPPLFVEEKFAA
jgi:hypothetical protein